MMRDVVRILTSINQATPLTDSILLVELAPERYVDYQAGQYLQILLGKEAYSFSIANAPLGSHKYELHIRHSRDNPAIQNILNEIKRSGAISVQLPLGQCHLKCLDDHLPILFIAAGTGFAPIKAMIEQLLVTGDTRTIKLFWGAKQQSDLYLDEMVSRWQTHVQHFQYQTLLTTHTRESLSARVLAHHQHDLADWQIVMGGPFDMVYQTRDVLVSHGARPEKIYSDAFDFEQKDA